MLSTVLKASGSLFHAVGAATVKPCIPMHLFELVEETGRKLLHVISLGLIKDDRCQGWVKFIGL